MYVVRPRQAAARVEVVFPVRRGVGDHVGRAQSLPSVGLGDAFHMPALSDERAVGWEGVNPVQHSDGKQVDRVILLVRILQLALQFRGEAAICLRVSSSPDCDRYSNMAGLPLSHRRRKAVVAIFSAVVCSDRQLARRSS